MENENLEERVTLQEVIVVRRVVVAFAGHVDHGKTALVKALTGVDCDRLEEEKRRGITIVPGFTRWDLPNGTTAGVVDVPGHEDFVKNMVSGVFGARIVILTVAADEGVMPQTREHFHICRLLGIEKMVVALTKVDLVGDEEVMLARDEIKDLLKGTRFEDAPIVEVSAVVGSGLNRLSKEVSRTADSLAPLEPGRYRFRLYVDRSFKIKGFGTVVTGTVLSGEVHQDAEVQVFPSNVMARVRGIEVHGEKVGAVAAGTRAALNFSGLSIDDAPRGALVTEPGIFGPFMELGACVEFLPGVKVPAGDKAILSLHVGTRKVGARMRILDRVSKDEYSVKLRLNAPVVAIFGERFVLRGSARHEKFGYTLGGGGILRPRAGDLETRNLASTLDRLMHAESPGDALQAFLEEDGRLCMDLSEAGAVLGLQEQALKKTAAGLVESGRAVMAGHVLSSRDRFKGLVREVIELVSGWNEAGDPSVQMIGDRLSRGNCRRIVEHAIEEAARAGAIEIDRGEVFEKGKRESPLSDLELRILEVYEKSGVTPPKDTQLYDKLGIEKDGATERALMNLHRSGYLVRVKSDLSFATGILSRLERRVVSYLEENESMTPAEFKELAGVTRKHAIPLLEYFDRERITMRVGDKRILRKRNK